MATGYQGMTTGYEGMTTGYRGMTTGYEGMTTGYQGMATGYQGMTTGYRGMTWQDTGSYTISSILRHFCTCVWGGGARVRACRWVVHMCWCVCVFVCAARVLQEALPQLTANKGNVVNVTSAYGQLAQPHAAAYATAKAAQDHVRSPHHDPSPCCPLTMFSPHHVVPSPRCPLTTLSPHHVPSSCPLIMSPHHVPSPCPLSMSPHHVPSACPLSSCRRNSSPLHPACPHIPGCTHARTTHLTHLTLRAPHTIQLVRWHAHTGPLSQTPPPHTWPQLMRCLALGLTPHLPAAPHPPPHPPPPPDDALPRPGAWPQGGAHEQRGTGGHRHRRAGGVCHHGESWVQAASSRVQGGGSRAGGVCHYGESWV